MRELLNESLSKDNGTPAHIEPPTVDVNQNSLENFASIKPKISGKRLAISRTPHGSNLNLKVKRQEQTANIVKVLDGMKHFLPTIKEILGGLWLTHPAKGKVALRALGLALPFCDGVGIPHTRLTSTDR